MNYEDFSSADILGTGPSLKHYKPHPGRFTIGVNDIFRFMPVDSLLVLDRPDRFTDDRLAIILESRPKFFLSDVDEWKLKVNNFYSIKFLMDNDHPGYPDSLDTGRLPRHVDSTYTAIGYAYFFLCPKNIVLWGVDLRDHPDLKFYWDQIRQAYIRMHRYLGEHKCNLFVGSSDSPLSEIIPVYHA